ncbi:hypothetical protein [Actinomadura kijaniata]|uniref:hypothetical protein n=1 Tax=Actinomadura kijaniata TaxID=46161 RepID=UPI001FDFA13D|nr:hypothetical protein [Actinomadura kijaniata]
METLLEDTEHGEDTWLVVRDAHCRSGATDSTSCWSGGALRNLYEKFGDRRANGR